MLLFFTTTSAGLLIQIRDRPPPRYEPSEAIWTTVRIEGNATSGDSDDAGWEIIEDNFGVSAPGDDPHDPLVYRFTAVSTDTSLRWFRLVWTDDIDIEYTTPAFYQFATPRWN